MNALANPFLNSALAPSSRAAESVTAPVLSLPVAVAANSVSDGGASRSLPSGESEPSVTLARAPSESNPACSPLAGTATVADGFTPVSSVIVANNSPPISGSPFVEIGQLAGVAFNGTPAFFISETLRKRSLPYADINPNRFPLYADAIMLAIADELSDELRTINEAILLREFGRES